MYSAHHALLYDVLHQEKDYSHEVSFLDYHFKKFGIPGLRLLDLACGTGPHTLRFKALGYDVSAIDISIDMLDIAKEKAAKESLEIHFQCSDMSQLALPNGSQDVSVCLFDSIGYLATDEKINETLECLRHAVSESGVVVFEYWHALAVLKSFDPLRVRKLRTEHGEIIRIASVSVVPECRALRVEYDLIYLYDDLTFSRGSDTHETRFFTVPEFNALLERAGFNLLANFAGYTQNHITDETWHILALARNK